MNQFSNIGIIGRDGHGVLEAFEALKSFLQAKGLAITLGETIAKVIPDRDQYRVCSRAEIGEQCDLIIVVGGDGSLLGAARTLSRFDTPVLGINRGRLGFLTDVLPEEIESKVGAVLAGDYTLEKRFLLDAEVLRGEQVIGKADALNDVVVNSGTSAQMIEFDLYIEGQFVYHQRSDGLIVSTPTGSTAYSLSGGGPIMHPRLDAIVLVPMFPHQLSSRPIVVDGNSELKLVISDRNQIHPLVTCDGQQQLQSEPGDVILIRKKPHQLTLIHPPGHSFYASCRDKLGWSAKIIDKKVGND